MKPTSKSQQKIWQRFSRRSILIGGVQLGFAGLLGLRMRQLQIKEADQFRLLAEENRINVRLIAPERGEIYDVNGYVLAENEPTYRITIVEENAGDVDDVLEKLRLLIELTEDDIARVKSEMKRSAPFLSVTLRDRVTRSEIECVAVNAPSLPGITPEVGLSRIYPLNDIFSHVVGYVGPVSSRDLKRHPDDDPLLRIPRFQIGKVGIESKLETKLRGRAGARQVEVNALGRVMRELERSEGSSGKKLQLTVDAHLQSYAKARLGEESASVVVMDCKTGALRAIASTPGYDPNKFVRGISYSDYDALRDNDHRPLASKTVQDAYPPGSTFKMVTVLAALEQGIITPDDTFFCPGHLDVSNRRFHCWKRGGHGKVDLETSLKESCDVYYYELALQVGIERIADMARRLGFGHKHDLPMSAISSGLAPDKQWKFLNRGSNWLIGDTVVAAIGQGYVSASPLQLAVMTARLASGLALDPQLVRAENGQNILKTDFPKLDVNPKHLQLVRDAMFSVTNDRKGTAYSSRVIADDARIAGKTGTSQVRNISELERKSSVIKNEDLPWERRDHALFVNYAPAHDPEIAVCVVVEHGGSGSAAAAPIARDITLQALYKGDPPLEAYPPKDREHILELQSTLRAKMPDLASVRKARV